MELVQTEDRVDILIDSLGIGWWSASYMAVATLGKQFHNELMKTMSIF